MAIDYGNLNSSVFSRAKVRPRTKKTGSTSNVTIIRKITVLDNHKPFANPLDSIFSKKQNLPKSKMKKAYETKTLGLRL